MGPVDALVALIVIGLPIILLITWSHSYFKYKEKQLDTETTLAAEKAAQYAVSNAELEQRVRVLEQIVTDAGAHTAAQIDALRHQPARIGRKTESAGGESAA
jgi:NADH:ubiquinone oxidoreductase subunit D